MQQADRRKYLNMPKSNMPKHAERRNMPEGLHLCMQMTKLKHAKSSNMPKHVAGRQKKVLKHAKIKHAEARGKKKHAGRTASLHANDQFHLTD